VDHLSDDFAWRGKSMVARLDGAAGGFMITQGILVQGEFFSMISLRVMMMMKVIFKCANQF